MTDSDIGALSDGDITTITAWDCTQCVHVQCWGGPIPDGTLPGTLPPQCIPLHAVPDVVTPGPVLPPPLVVG